MANFCQNELRIDGDKKEIKKFKKQAKGKDEEGKDTELSLSNFVKIPKSQEKNWYDWNIQSTWTPFYVYPHRIPNMPTVLMPVPRMLNLPFIIFCVIIVTNCVVLATYFFVIPRLQRLASKDI